jgi:transcriptional regulator with XRE-family HTH domain
MRAANVLRHARHRAGLTQRELALAARVPQSTVGRIESNRLNPTLDNLRNLLNAAGHDLDLVPLAGRDEDRTLIRDRLRMTPARRAALAIQEARFGARLSPQPTRRTRTTR